MRIVLPDKYLTEQIIHWGMGMLYNDEDHDNIWGSRSQGPSWKSASWTREQSKVPKSWAEYTDFARSLCLYFLFYILYFAMHCGASAGDCSGRRVTRTTAFINQGTLDLSLLYSSLQWDSAQNTPYIQSRAAEMTTKIYNFLLPSFASHHWSIYSTVKINSFIFL